MSLFDLVEQENRIGLPAHGLGELPALLVADVPGRRADEAGHRVPLHVFAHVDAHDVVFAVEQSGGQGLGELGLAHPGGAEKDERTDRPPRVLDAGARPDDGVRHQLHGFVLAHDALVQNVIQAQQLVAFAFDQSRDGHARPARHDGGDFLLGNFFPQQTAAVASGHAGFGRFQALQQVGQLPVTQFGSAVEVVGPLSLLDVAPHLLDLFPQGPYLADGAFLRLPLRPQGVVLFLQVRQFLAQGLEPVLAGPVGFLVERCLFDFELHDTAGDFVQFGRHRVDFGAHHGAGFVHQVDGLVGQETVSDVAVGEHRRADQGVVLNAHAVVHLVALPQAAQDRNGVFD